MVKKLLFKDGKLAFKDGKLVIVDDPSACDCCETTPTITCCGGCSNVPGSVTVNISGMTDTATCCAQYNGTWTLTQCKADDQSNSGEFPVCTYGLAPVGVPTHPCGLGSSFDTVPGVFYMNLSLHWAAGSLFITLILEAGGMTDPSDPCAGLGFGSYQVFNATIDAIDCIDLTDIPLTYNAGLSNTGAFTCSADAAAATVTISTGATTSDCSGTNCVSCNTDAISESKWFVTITKMVTTNGCTVDCATYWNKTFEVPWSFTGGEFQNHFCQWVYYLPDYIAEINSNACGTEYLAVNINWDSTTNETTISVNIYPEPDCGWNNPTTITGKISCDPGSYSVDLVSDFPDCLPPGGHGSNCEWSDVTTIRVFN